MATLIPPQSKRLKLEASKSAQDQGSASIPGGLGNVRVQFFDRSNGNSTGAAVAIPVADTTVKNLEFLLNSLLGNVCMLALLLYIMKRS